MADISTLWDTTRGDWSLAGADLVSGNDIVTAVLLSLFTDRQANPDDVIPDGSDDPRGWWGDDAANLVGSRLWLIERSKKTQQTLGLAQQFIEEALQWLIADGISSQVDVYVEWTRDHTLGAQVTVYRTGNPAPIKIATQNVFGIPQIQSWGWNDEAGTGEWKPVLVVQETFDYYTSILYPTFGQDSLSVGVPSLRSGQMVSQTIDTLSVALPTLTGGTLAATVNHLNYDATPFPDTLSVGVPPLQSGTLVVTISYATYDARPFPDTTSVQVPTLQSGTLVVTISYVNYTNPLTYFDTLSVAVPALTGGTLV